MFAWLLLGSLALAKSQLVITTDRPVVVVVNLKPYPLQGGSAKLVVDFPDGKEGAQRVMIRNLLGQEVWSGSVTVPRDQRVAGEWLAGTMQFAPPQSLSRRRLSDQGLYNVNGEWEYRSSAPAPGEGQPEGPKPGDGEDLFVDVVAEASEADQVGGVVPVEIPPDRPAPGQSATLALQNRTTSWANLVVDGEAVPFRGERRKELPVGSGPHRVEVRDFHDKLVYLGTVWLPADTVVELQFSETAPPAVPGEPDAFEPDELPGSDAP